MALTRLALAWVLVAAWFAAFHSLRSRLDSSLPPVRRDLPPLLLESLLLVLLAGLWFGSLGSGGWLLLFGLVAALVVLPPHLREVPGFAWKSALAGVCRLVLAGWICAFLLG